MYTVWLILLISIIMCKEKENNNQTYVVQITDDSFDTLIQTNDYVLVKFFVPWCIHCKALAPAFTKAAKILNKDGIILAEMDCTKNRKISHRFKIKGYPTMKFFYKGRKIDYSGGRSDYQIVSWAIDRKKSFLKEIKTTQEVEDYTKKYEVIIVYFGEDNDELVEVEMAARDNPNFQFFFCNNADVYYDLYTNEGNIVLFKTFDEKTKVFTGNIEKNEITDFIKENSSPLVMAFDEKAAKRVFGSNIPGLILFRDENERNTPKMDGIMREVARKFRGKIQAIVSDIKEGLGFKMADYAQIVYSDLPTIRLIDTRNDLDKYAFDPNEEITATNVELFIYKWQKGKLKKESKSEPIPLEQMSNVFKLVGKTFNKYVINSEKDVLVKFYASFCKHSKQLAPIYERLADKFSQTQDLLIAEIEATVNELDVNISGYPTIYLYKHGQKNRPIEFRDERTIEALEKFLRNHCEYSLDSFPPEKKVPKEDL